MVAISVAYSDPGGSSSPKFGSQGDGGGQFGYPESIATDASGHLYIADFGS
jgi:hypothetical protein